MILKKAVKFIKYLFLCLAILFVLLIAVVNLPFSQRIITEKTNTFLRNKNFPVSVGKITLLITGRIGISDIQMTGARSDTIVFSKRITVSVRIIPVLRKNLIVNNITINDAVVNIKTDSVTGVLNLISVFKGEENPDKKPKEKKGGKWDIGVKSVNLKNIRFSYNDRFRGIHIFESLKKLTVGFESFSVANRKIHAGNLKIEDATGGIDLIKSAKKKEVLSSKKPGASWKFLLNRGDLKAIRFSLHQPDNNSRMEFAVTDGDISYAGVDLADQKISFDEVNLNGPDAHIYMTPSVVKPAPAGSAAGSVFPGLWKISGSKITIAGGSFHKDDYTGKSDSSKIYQVANLSTTIRGIRLDSLASGFEMNRLSLVLENGFSLENSKIIFSSDSARNTNADLNLKTASGRVSVKLNAGEKLATILKSYKKVPFSVVIEDSEVSVSDFLVLIPSLRNRSEFTKNEDLRLGLNCDISGTADLLKIGKIDLFTANGVRFSSSGLVKDLLTRSSATLSLSFAAGGISKSLVDELLVFAGSTAKIPDFGSAVLEGKIDSTLSNPYFTLSVKSNSGDVDLTGSLSLSDKIYSIRTVFSGIQLGKISGVPELGLFSGRIDLNGKGFSPYTLTLKASAAIDTAFYNEYNYSNIKINLDADQGVWLFGIDAADPAIRSAFTGTLRLSETQVGGKISGLFSLDAGKLNLYNGLSVKGELEAAIDNTSRLLKGSVSLKNIVINKDNKTEELNSAVFSFHSSETRLSGNIESEFLRANGTFEGSLEDIKKALKEGRIKGSAIADSTLGNRIPYFSSISGFDISVESTYDPIISVFLSDSLFSYNRVSFNFSKDSTGTGQADLIVDRFNIGKTSAFGADLKFENHPDKSFLKISADSITLERISFEALSTDITIVSDTAIYNLEANGRNDSLIYDINWIAIRNGGKIKLKPTQNQWVVNGLRWDVNMGDFLVFDRNKNDMAVDLHWKKGNQSIDIYGKKSGMISFELSKVWLSQLIFPGMYTYKYDGEFNGKIDYTGTAGKREIEANMGIRQINMDNKLLGDLLISGKLMTDTIGTLEADVNAIMNDTSSIMINVRSVKSSGMKVLNLEFSRIRLNTFEPFLINYISGLQGEVNGNLSFSGDGTRNQLAGRLKINNTALRVVPLNASFYLPEEVIGIENSKLVFNKFTVLDSLKNRLSLNGTINLEDFKNITASLQVSSDQLQIMNTTGKDNPGFNGSIFINTDINISGPVKRPSLNGNIMLADGTVINYRYTENLAVSETEKTVVFTSFKQDQSAVLVKPVVPDQLQRTPNVEATVEIDPGSLFNFQVTRGFDVGVSIRGGGFLTYSMMQNKEIDLSGTYEINQGSSELKIPGWPRKDFIITPGSFIKWNGKLDDPELNVSTTSNVRGSYLNPVDQKNREVNFIVYMKLSGRLSELEILFDVRSEDQYITTVFNALSADERMRQAINLLIFGSIQLPNLSSSSNYLTQQINQFWESQLNQLTKSAFRKIDVSLGLDSYTEGATSKTYTSLSYQVKKEMFKDRGSVLVSGHMNDNTPTSQQSNAVIENFIFEYALDTNRTKFVKVYRQQNYEDLLEGQVVKSGIGFIYRKSYDRLSDIWRRQKRAKK